MRFLALSVSDAAEDVIAVIRAGARGYVTKTISGNDLTTAVRRVADGDAVFSPRLAGFVLDAFGAAAGEIAEVDEELDRLCAREREVMRLIARGLPVQGSGQRAVHLDQDGRDPRVLGAAQAPAVVPARADRLGGRSPPALTEPNLCKSSPRVHHDRMDQEPCRVGVEDDGRLLTVGMVAARLGVAPETVRSWERRYGLAPGGRSPGGHRRYTETDCGRLVLMQRLVGEGANAARAAAQVLATPVDAIEVSAGSWARTRPGPSRQRRGCGAVPGVPAGVRWPCRGRRRRGVGWPGRPAGWTPRPW